MPNSVYISACLVLLVAISRADSKNGLTIHIKGPAKIIKGCQVPTADQCVGVDGFCVENGDRCNGTFKFLHNSCTDMCTCCVPDKQECPEGFFMTKGSTQCFKLFNDEMRTWEDGGNKCNSEGLYLAEPSSDAVAVALRKDVIDRYGSDSRAWIGGRGDGDNIRWQRSGKAISNSSPLWWPRHPNGATYICLRLLAYDMDMERYPGVVYGAGTDEFCSERHPTLCELVME